MSERNDKKLPADKQSEIRVMLRVGAATVCNIVLMAIFPRFAMQGSVKQEISLLFLAGAVSAPGVVVVIPIFRRPEFGYRLAALMLGIFPTLNLLIALLGTIQRFWK